MDVVTYEEFVRKLFNITGTAAVDFTHAMLGLTTEIYELIDARDGVNALEELGDLEFYLQAMLQVLEKEFGPAMYDEAARLEQILLKAFPQISTLPAHHVYPFLLNELQDISKRWIGYGKAPSVPPLVIMAMAAAAVHAASAVAVGRGNFEPDRIRRANVGKLLKRYNGMAFSQERAIKRDLGAERAVLDAAATAS